MKKSFAILAAFTALVSCNKFDGTVAEKTAGISVSASLPEGTKAHFGTLSAGAYPLVWDASEKALLMEYVDGALQNEKASTSYTKSSDSEASFGFTLPEDVSGTSYDYLVGVPFGETTENGIRKKEKNSPPVGYEKSISYALVHKEAAQTPLADAPDPSTHILVASKSGEAGRGDMNLNFSSVVSYGKMRVTGFPALATGETPSRIVITAPAGTIMRGRLWDKMDGSATKPFSDAAQSNFVNVNPENITFNTTGFDVWFTTFPFDLENGDKLDVTVNTNKGAYCASITLSKNLKFEAGKVSSFTYNWAKGLPVGTDKVLSFDFSGTSLDGWPTAQGGSQEHRDVTCYYHYNGENYTFHLFEAPEAKGGKIYWTSSNGYFSFAAQYRYMSLPIIAGYTLKTVECTVGKKIESSESYITDEIGGITTAAHPNTVCDAQSWNTAVGTVIKYDVNSTDTSKQYYLYCKSKGAAMSKLTLTYSPVSE